jgi:hypothetical protein
MHASHQFRHFADDSDFIGKVVLSHDELMAAEYQWCDGWYYLQPKETPAVEEEDSCSLTRAMTGPPRLQTRDPAETEISQRATISVAGHLASKPSFRVRRNTVGDMSSSDEEGGDVFRRKGTTGRLGLLRLRYRYAASVSDETLSKDERDKLQSAALTHALRNRDRSEPVGHMKISIVEAQNLPKMDIFGTCDPFVQIQFEGNTYKTEVVKQTLAPEWNQSWSLEVHRLDSPISMVVYDWDRGVDGKDSDYDSCGDAVFDIEHELEGELEFDKWIAIFQKIKGIDRARGSVRVKLEYIPALGFAPGALNKQPKPKRDMMAMVDLTLVKGDNLPAMDDFGSSDPYCVVTVSGPVQPSQTFKTAVMTQTVNPQWTHKLSIKVVDPEAVVKIEVFDEDYTADEFMGGMQIPVMTLISDTNAEEHWYRLYDEVATQQGGALEVVDNGQLRDLTCPLGTLFIRKEVHLVPALDAIPENCLGKLCIRISDIRGLFLHMKPKAAKKNLHDLFVQVTVGADRRFTRLNSKESVQWKDSAEPNATWNETFGFYISSLRMVIRADVCAWDLLGDHRVLASASCAMSEAIHLGESASSPAKCVSLWGRASRGPMVPGVPENSVPQQRGELSLAFEWTPASMFQTLPAGKHKSSLKSALRNVLMARRLSKPKQSTSLWKKVSTAVYSKVFAQQQNVVGQARLAGAFAYVVPTVHLVQLTDIAPELVEIFELDARDGDERQFSVYAELVWNGVTVSRTPVVQAGTAWDHIFTLPPTCSTDTNCMLINVYAKGKIGTNVSPPLSGTAIHFNGLHSQQTTQSGPTKLPIGWEAHYDSSHQANYYVNTATGESSWLTPRSAEEEAAATKIQRMVRARAVRARLRSETAAAVKIQRIIRGCTARTTLRNMTWKHAEVFAYLDVQRDSKLSKTEIGELLVRLRSEAFGETADAQWLALKEGELDRVYDDMDAVDRLISAEKFAQWWEDQGGWDYSRNPSKWGPGENLAAHEELMKEVSLLQEEVSLLQNEAAKDAAAIRIQSVVRGRNVRSRYLHVQGGLTAATAAAVEDEDGLASAMAEMQGLQEGAEEYAAAVTIQRNARGLKDLEEETASLSVAAELTSQLLQFGVQRRVEVPQEVLAVENVAMQIQVDLEEETASSLSQLKTAGDGADPQAVTDTAGKDGSALADTMAELQAKIDQSFSEPATAGNDGHTIRDTALESDPTLAGAMAELQGLVAEVDKSFGESNSAGGPHSTTDSAAQDQSALVNMSPKLILGEFPGEMVQAAAQIQAVQRGRMVRSGYSPPSSVQARAQKSEEAADSTELEHAPELTPLPKEDGTAVLLLGCVKMLAGGVRGFPRKPYAFNLIAPDTTVRFGTAQQAPGQLTVCVVSEQAKQLAEDHRSKIRRGRVQLLLHRAMGLRVLSHLQSDGSPRSRRVYCTVSVASSINAPWHSKNVQTEPQLAPDHYRTADALEGSVATLETLWDESTVVSVLGDDTFIEIRVFDSTLVEPIACVGLPISLLKRSLSRYVVALHDPTDPSKAFQRGIRDVSGEDLDSCSLGVLEFSCSCKWKGYHGESHIEDVVIDAVTQAS